MKLVAGNLPVDISFADENDILLFWSGETYKTCDARYIGRDIRDCHPEGSLEVLERILADSKQEHATLPRGGTRMTADSTTRAIRPCAPRSLQRHPGVEHVPRGIPLAERSKALPGW